MAESMSSGAVKKLSMVSNAGVQCHCKYAPVSLKYICTVGVWNDHKGKCLVLLCNHTSTLDVLFSQTHPSCSNYTRVPV